MFWIHREDQPQKDVYVAFRGVFELAEHGQIELHTLGASWYGLWLDDELLLDGPPRHDRRHPEYQVNRLALAAGRHVLAVQVHEIGERTERHPYIEPFLYCRVLKGAEELPVRWRCSQLPGYRSQVRRISPQHGWIEWCDTGRNPAGWRKAEFDDADWAEPVPVARDIGELRSLSSAPVRLVVHPLVPQAAGPLAHLYGWQTEDVATQFFLRDRVCDRLPPQGVWRRYDLGRVRLGRPRLVMDVPAGTVVEFAASESLLHDRVSPYISLAGGYSANMDHYEARGGVQEFCPLTPKGGRFVEVHVMAPREKVRFLREEYVERCYFGPPDGEFVCGDELLERIWRVGVATVEACAEDAIVDNPTRERGQWLGDTLSVGMEIVSAAWSDLRLCRRALVQSAYGARDDGMVAGLCPGFLTYLSTYALQWVRAAVRYYQLTGDLGLLEELYPHAVRNLSAFEKFISDDGLVGSDAQDAGGLGWTFVDWGYARNPGPSDMALNLHFVGALRSMGQWCGLLDRPDDARKYTATEAAFTALLHRWFKRQLDQGEEEAWNGIGFHRAALGLLHGFFGGDTERACVQYLKRHILDCFPNDPDAPRLWGPGFCSPRLMTPYFLHFVFPLLIERGEMDFVLDQFRHCWGWALEDRRTTWVEVFDTRWSHCHHWSGCPTWQLSRYALGLDPRFDLGHHHYVLDLRPGSLRSARGRVPTREAGRTIAVDWTREEDAIRYRLAPPAPIWVHLAPPAPGRSGRMLEVREPYEIRIPR